MSMTEERAAVVNSTLGLAGFLPRAGGQWQRRGAGGLAFQVPDEASDDRAHGFASFLRVVLQEVMVLLGDPDVQLTLAYGYSLAGQAPDRGPSQASVGVFARH
jgi:hypothetical protein